MIEELIPIFGILLGIGGPAVVIIVWFSLNYYKRRKLMELHHAERMAAIERGMEIPPLPIELIDGRSVPKRRRTALLPGLVWFFIGLAYLIYYFAEGRKVEARWLEHDLAQRSSGRPAPPV